MSDEVTITHDKSYYIDEIAMLLAGRVAEKMYTSSISGGAEADLESANQYANFIVTKLGMASTESNKTYTFNNEYYRMSDKMCNAIDEEVKKILESAEERAKEIIKVHYDELQVLVDMLMKKGILDFNDLKKLKNTKEK